MPYFKRISGVYCPTPKHQKKLPVTAGKDQIPIQGACQKSIDYKAKVDIEEKIKYT